MTLILILAILLIILLGGYLWIVKKNHGYVEFKTGLLLKMLPEINGEIDLLRLRQEYLKRSQSSLFGKKPPMANVADIKIPTRHGDIKARAYINDTGSNAPLIVFYHGGGWCIGSIDTHDEQCIRISQASGHSVLSLDYSLSPECKFPIAVEECIDATEWVLANSEIDYAHNKGIVLMGDSAGGNLSIVVTMELIRKGLKNRISSVVPIYPATDCFSEKGGSFSKYDSGYMLTRNTIDAFEKGYFETKQDAQSILASPLLAEDLPTFPDTYIVTAEYDTLRDEGEDFASRLEENGTNVIVRRYAGAIHGFFGKAAFGKKGIQAANELGTYLKSRK